MQAYEFTVILGIFSKKSPRNFNAYQALRVETANPLYFSAYIIRLRYKVADFVV